MLMEEEEKTRDEKQVKDDKQIRDEKQILKERRDKLNLQQQLIKEKKLPVLVLVEGWGAAGKGTLISYLIRDLDPRFFRVIPMKDPTEEEKRKPFLWRYMEQIPEQGKFRFMDSGWMQECVREKMQGVITEDEYQRRIESVRTFERQLCDNGYLVLKFFIDISGKEQKKRVDKLSGNKNTKWRVNSEDLWQIQNHKQWEVEYQGFMEATDTFYAPWYKIDGRKAKNKELEVCTILTDAIDAAIARNRRAVKLIKNNYPLVKMPKLAQIDLNKDMTEEEYEVELKVAQKKLKKLHNKLYRHQIPVVIAYEGWDAAGKGGNIKRLTAALDARGVEVHPIAAPEPHELHRHYLWRFWTRLPKTGHIAIFDRTWYGRVMVERLEGLCKTNEWRRAYNEINEFEKELTDWGAIVLKFWIQIDKDTQLERFTERQNTPAKRWKITDEDWRNREKWDLYEGAIDEMIKKTSTENASWQIIESNNKYYARIKVLNAVIEAIEKRLE